ncbi:MAG: DUF262 domain-containing protein [Lentisphaeria bacterium]|nr:DUF262 domain-containing protein [Lentisphaeria bacterium]
MKYYVVSPNAANDGLADKYLAYMKRQHVVFMGWDTSHKSGAMFSKIQPGDCILVARRQKWVWKSYFSGIADSEPGYDNESGEGFEQRIELRQFTDLAGCENVIPFTKGCTSYERQIPGAIFQLNPENEHDLNIIRLLDFFANRSARFYTLREISRWQDNDRVSIPALQRGLVWKPKQVELLWDSLLRGFPIGAFAVSSVLANLEQKVADTKTEYFLLDGQQRYNAISLGYHRTDALSQAALWLDFCPPKRSNSSRCFWVKTTTSAHPWGFANDDDCNVLGWGKYRVALNSFVPTEKDISKIKLQSLSLVDTWPIESGCPIPLFEVMDCYSRSCSCDQATARPKFKKFLEEWLKNFRHTHQRFSPQEIDQSVSDRIFDALVQLQSYTVTVDVLRNQFLYDMDDASSVASSSLEHLFTRLNTMGSPISPYDLRYSAIKAYWAEIKNANDEIASSIMPTAHLAVLAFRLGLTLASGKNVFADTPSIPEIRKLGKDHSTDAYRIICDLYRDNGYLLRQIIQKVEVMLNVGSEDKPDGLPPVIRTSIILNSPDVYLALMYLAYHEIREAGFDNCNIQGMALWLHWLSLGNKKQNVDYLKSTLEKLSPQELKIKLRELCDMERLIPLLPQFDIGDYQDQQWRIESLDEKEWKPLLDFCLWNKELLIFGERQYFNKTFCYDPALQNFLQGHNKPWDWDHIVPRSWVTKQGKTMGPWKGLCREWLWTNGNFAAIPFSINRGKSNAAQWQEYCSYAGELQFDSRILNLQESNLTYEEKSAKLFADVSWHRTLQIYKCWYEQVSDLL